MAEIGLDHLRVGGNRSRCAGGNQLAVIQHIGPVGQVHHRLHHMFDQENGHAGIANALDDSDDLVDLRRVQAGHHFVKKQQARPGCQGPRQFKAFATGNGQIVGIAVKKRCHSDNLGDLFRFLFRIRPAGRL